MAGRKNQDQVLKELNNSKFFVLSSVTEGIPKALIETLPRTHLQLLQMSVHVDQ